MAKVTEVVSSLAVKVNIGDYQSVDFFASLKAEIGEHEAVEDIRGALNRTLQAGMLIRLRSHFRARGKKFDDAQICRMYGLTQPTQPKETEFP